MSEESAPKQQKKAVGRPFKPGESGNPNGRPMTPVEIVEMKKMNRNEAEKILNEFIHLPLGIIEKIADDPTTPGLKAVLASAYVKAHAVGNYNMINFLLDRLIGKVRDAPENNAPKPTVIKLLDGSQVILGTDKKQGE